MKMIEEEGAVDKLSVYFESLFIVDSELQHILNISCADNGTIAITWNVRSALYLFIQIEYQCYYGSYNEVMRKINNTEGWL